MSYSYTRKKYYYQKHEIETNMYHSIYKKLFLPICLLLSINTFGAHIIGGDISYECLGNDQYRIIIKVYRDCGGGGASFDSPSAFTNMHVTVYEGNNTVPFISEIDFGEPTIVDIDPTLGNACIEAPPNVCVETGTYEQIVTLPASPNSYHLAYQRCCRNNTITNIPDSGDFGATYFIEITSFAQEECNNSPVFDNFPPPVICIDEQLNYDHGATDVEGDQLVYSFCSPLQGGGRDGDSDEELNSFTGLHPNPDSPPPYDELIYALPDFSALSPLGSESPISINPTTGQISGLPTQIGQFVVGICVSEYRNGVLLSRVQRDFQFNVTECEILVDADIMGVDFDPALDQFEYLSCGDFEIDFTNLSTDQAFIEAYLWKFNISEDSVLSLANRDVTVTFPGPGEYTGTMTLNPGLLCSDSMNFIVKIAPPLNATFGFSYDTCVIGPVDFFDITALSSPYELQIDNWQWNFGDGQSSNDTTANHLYEDAGSYLASLTLTDIYGCQDVTGDSVHWYPAPEVIVIKPSKESGCNPLEVSYENLSYPVDENYDIQWDFGRAGTGTGLVPTVRYDEPGIYDVYVEITSPLNCYTDTLFTEIMLVDTFPIASFDYQPDYGSTFDTDMMFTDSSIRAGAWQWNFFDMDGNSYDAETYEQNPSFTFPDTGQHRVELVISHYNDWDCYDTTFAIVDIIPETRFFMPNAFTPNGDAKNDIFRPAGYFAGARNYSMEIWSRWGDLVFQSSNFDAGWDGRLSGGKLAPPGVYVCLIRFDGPRGKPYEYKGFTTLIR